MSDQSTASHQSNAPTAFDPIAEDLRALRISAGAPSFGVLVQRIRSQRELRGIAPAAAAIPRTTIYMAFTSGRTRVDPDLVWEIVLALGVSEAEAEEWRTRCSQVRGGAADVAPAGVAEAEARLALRVRGSAYLWLILIASLGINMAGRSIVEYGHLSLYLDMVGTAVAAIVLGPWWGAGVGVTTSVLGSAITTWNSVPFGLVEIVGALIWGYGVRRWQLGRTVPRFFLLNILVAAACSMTAVPIIVGVDGGLTGNAADGITKAYEAMGNGLVQAVAWQNLSTSLMDKMLSGFIALAVIESIPKSYRGDWNRVSLTGSLTRGARLARSYVLEPR